MVRFLVLLAAAAALTVCCVSASGLGLFGEGAYAQELRTVEGFERIEARGPVEVVVRRGAGGILTLRGSRDRVEDLVTRVAAGTLFVEGSRVTVIVRVEDPARVRADSLATGCCERSEATASRFYSCTGSPATPASGRGRLPG